MADNYSPRPLVHLNQFEPVNPEVISLLPAGLVIKQMIIPVSRKEGTLTVAVARTEGVVKPEGLALITGCQVEFVVAPADEIVDFIKRYYQSPTPRSIVVPVENIIPGTPSGSEDERPSSPAVSESGQAASASSSPVADAPPVNPSAVILHDTPVTHDANDTLSLVVGAPVPGIEDGKKESPLPQRPPSDPSEEDTSVYVGDEPTDLDPEAASLFDLDPNRKSTPPSKIDMSFLEESPPPVGPQKESDSPNSFIREESISPPGPVFKPPRPPAAVTHPVSEPNNTVSVPPPVELVVSDGMKKIELTRLESNLIPEFIQLMSHAIRDRASETWLTLKSNQLLMRERIRGTFVPMDISQTGLDSGKVETLMGWIKELGEKQSAEGMLWVELRKELVFENETYNTHCFLTETKVSRVLTIRVHSQKEAIFSPSTWGMDPSQIKMFTEFLERKQGFLLFAGSEQEGLTQNVHACAKHLATPKRHVIIVEPYIETWLSGVEQYFSKGRPKVFSQFLQVAFKHSPDVVLANPLEKREHFEMCLSESLKGRLVIGRSYALDSADALVQLASMGVEPYLVESALMGVISKRTLRLNCPICQTQDPTGRSQARELGIPDAMQPAAFYFSRGCEACHMTGFSGETDIFEILIMSTEIRNLFNKNVRVEEIRSHIKSTGLLTLRQVAVHKAINGQTSLAEVVRTTPK